MRLCAAESHDIDGSSSASSNEWNRLTLINLVKSTNNVNKDSEEQNIKSTQNAAKVEVVSADVDLDAVLLLHAVAGVDRYD